MPKEVLEYRCLLISPGDVREDRDGLTSTVVHWNAQVGDALGARVELVKWETHSAPDISAQPQDVLNRQIVENCDFAVAIFWYRLGTPTNNYDSGSIEEINKLRESGKRVLVYFCSRAIPQDALDIDQFKRLQDVKNEFQEQGLLGSYSDTENLKQQFLLHLTKVVSDLLSKDRSDISQFRQLQPTTLPKPDVRVKVKGGLAMMPFGEAEDILIIEVQNHSPTTVFLGNVQIRLQDKRNLFPPTDAITREYQKRRELRPGEKFSFNISPSVVTERVQVEEVVCAVVSDDIERTYESDPEELQSLLKGIVERKKNA
ncbi:MAG: hypothetical protein QME44_02465 [Thermodesulfobacteriota bacterium]|nr:hypothetical protein [Thermodesulfobacteriota bacterium]